MTDTKRMLIAAGGLALVLVMIALFAFGPANFRKPTDETATAAATSTQETVSPEVVADVQQTTSAQDALSPVPAGAVSIDDYAYVQNGEVYFRSMTGGEGVVVKQSDAATFKSLTSFAQHQGTAVVSDCGASGTYRFYADKDTLYFYQIWKTPRFTASKIEAVIGSSPKKFSALGNESFTDGTDIFNVGYYITTTSTCRFQLNKA